MALDILRDSIKKVNFTDFGINTPNVSSLSQAGRLLKSWTHAQ